MNLHAYTGFEGFQDGLYDFRGADYEHRWIVIYGGHAIGFHARAEARTAWAAREGMAPALWALNFRG